MSNQSKSHRGVVVSGGKCYAEISGCGVKFSAWKAAGHTYYAADPSTREELMIAESVLREIGAAVETAAVRGSDGQIDFYNVLGIV